MAAVQRATQVASNKSPAKGPDPITGKVKKEKVARVPWGVRDGEGKLVTKIKGKEVGDYDPKKHLPLIGVDFENVADYLELQADRMEARVKVLRKRAQEDRELGSVEDRAKARKLRSLHAKFAALTAELKASGMPQEVLDRMLAD